MKQEELMLTMRAEIMQRTTLIFLRLLRNRAVLVLFFCTLTFSVAAHAQWREPPMTGSQPEMLTDRTVLAGQAGLGPLMSAELVNEARNAHQHRAVVQVQTDGVHLVDPASVHYVPKLDQAHIQYRLDQEAVINSTSLTMPFENLSGGEHRIQVALAGNDNKPVGEQKTLKVYIP